MDGGHDLQIFDYQTARVEDVQCEIRRLAKISLEGQWDNDTGQRHKRRRMGQRLEHSDDEGDRQPAGRDLERLSAIPLTESSKTSS